MLVDRISAAQTHGGREYPLPPRCAACDGFTRRGGTAVGERDREGLERLCRYVARPGLGARRVHHGPDGLVALTLKTVPVAGPHRAAAPEHCQVDRTRFELPR